MIIGIERYYFLFAIGLIYTVFAVAEDWKKREVANWLNFSLIAFALAYRMFYASYFSDWGFFWFGLLGLGLFFILGNALYFTSAFGGGDAKLLFAYGLLLPIESWTEGFYVIFGFFLLLMIVGVIYSLFYSGFLAFKSWKKFKAEWNKNMVKRRGLFYITLIIILLWCAGYLILFGFANVMIYGAGALAIIPFLLIYLFSLDKCMITLTPPGKLTEGDWIVEGVKLRNYFVRKTAYGLTVNDIEQLKKARKAILVREGIPFTPTFLVSLIIMVFFYAILGQNFQQLLAALFL